MRPTSPVIALLSVFNAACTRDTPGEPVVEISVAGDTSCARTRAGQIYCWGDPAFRNPSVSARDLPPPQHTRPRRMSISSATSLSNGDRHGCAVTAQSGECWEVELGAEMRWLRYSRPELKGATLLSSASIGSTAKLADGGVVQFTFLGSGFGDGKVHREARFDELSSVRSGDFKTCGLADGGVYCPEPVAGLENVTAVTVGSAYACALKSSGSVACWGANGSGQLGTGPAGFADERAAPLEVPGITGAVAIAAGVYHSCAITTGARVSCWGDNRFGQLGKDLDLQATSVSLGTFHSCALDADGAVWCWGSNRRGQLGNGSTTDSAVPRKVKW